MLFHLSKGAFSIMRQQKIIRLIAIIVAAALLFTTLFAGIGSFFL